MNGSGPSDRILLLDDEPAIVEVLGTYLRDEGFVVFEAFDGLSGLELALTERPTLVILDLNLPKLHGSEVFRRLREVYDVPVIVLTSRVNEVDRVVSLELGADDYIGKPFSPREVVARVKSVLRRSHRRDDQPGPLRPAVQHVGALEIDRGAHEVRRCGVHVPLTPMEFRILETLATHLGQVLTREQLIDRTARDGDIYDRTLDRHVGNLRQKIEDEARNPTFILTVHGVGYKMMDFR
jgi:DNA-binding response OmpR family regulator